MTNDVKIVVLNYLDEAFKSWISTLGVTIIFEKRNEEKLADPIEPSYYHVSETDFNLMRLAGNEEQRLHKTYINNSVVYQYHSKLVVLDWSMVNWGLVKKWEDDAETN